MEVLDDALEDGLDGGGWVGLRLLGAGLAAGKDEQLLLQLAAAGDGGFQAAYLGLEFGREVVFGEAFGLQAEGGGGGAQFVGGIGDEALLLLHGLVGAVEQLIDGVDKALNFAGGLLWIKRGEIGGLALLQFLRLLAQGVQGATDLPDEQGDGKRNGGEDGGGAVPCDALGEVVAVFVFLVDDDFALLGGLDVNAVGVVVIAFGKSVEAVGQVAGFGQGFFVRRLLGAGADVDARVVFAFLRFGQGLAGVDVGGDLAQEVVLDFVGLVVGGVKR